MSFHKIILLTVLFHLTTSNYLRITSSSSSIIDYFDGKCSIVKCGTSVCATSPNGECVNDTCICNKGYTSKEDDYPVTCCYKQKKLVTALCLEIFLSFGFGHLYRGDKIVAFIKMAVYLILTISLSVLMYESYKLRGHYKGFWFTTARSACLLICSCTYIGWQITDILIYGLNGYKDGKGVDLY